MYIIKTPQREWLAPFHRRDWLVENVCKNIFSYNYHYMNIIIPLCGKGERFLKAGYKSPKPFIKALDKEILFHVIDNLQIGKDDKAYIVYHTRLDENNFKKVIETKYPFITLITLYEETGGACETIYLGLKEIKKLNLPLHDKTILVDGDTFYTENIIEKFRNVPSDTNAVFYKIDTNPNPVFSYIKIDQNDVITQIREKDKISDLANTGAYCFCKVEELFTYCNQVIQNNLTFNYEFYLSCVIHEMIAHGCKFIGIELRDVFVLGTPEQVDTFIKSNAYTGSYTNDKKLFLFDMDGTIIITDYIHFMVWKTILQDYHVEMDIDMFNKYVQGNSDSYVINKILPNISICLHEFSKRKSELFMKHVKEIEIIDGIFDLMREIKRSGHIICIVTNCNRDIAETIIKNLGFNDYIDSLIIGSECKNPKPYPDPYLEACRLHNKCGSDAFIFEDSKSGILSGRGINPKCIIGITSMYKEDELYNLGVNIAINNYNDLKLGELLNYKPLQNNIEKLVKNSLNLSIKDVKIYDEKLKGGYISDVLRLDIQTNKEEPLNCVLKLENHNESNLSKMANKLGLYDREYYFYENISRYVNVNVPKFYGLIKDENFNNIGILLENMFEKEKDIKINLNLNDENINVSLTIIEHLSKMHSRFWNKNLKNIFPSLMKNNDALFNPSWEIFISSKFDAFLFKWGHMFTQPQISKAKNIVSNFSKIQNMLSQKNLTLCHGDVKSLNIFYEKSDAGSYIPHFIDLQYTSNGKGPQDLVFFMIESFDIEKINIYFELFKQYYYVKLLENGVENYSFSDYETDFIYSICCYPFFVAIWFGTTPEEDLIDKNFPFFYIQKVFNFIEKYVPDNFSF
jgi:beta-phosphoglucomutase-like phosphatase (HAD superfamily)/choline kinase